ncbi:MAG: DedA family protein [Anaerolineae bacterium]|nr:DedA family protein [Anaerolineae bacterium]
MIPGIEILEQTIILFLESLFGMVGWFGVVLAMAIESACIPLPSEVTMPLAGWFLIEARGYPVWHVIWAGLYGGLGCTIGSVATYWIGALGGRPLLEKYGKYVLISRHDIEVADRWFNRWGEATAFFSRLLPVVRTFISLPAGVARMNFGKFTLLSFIGSFIWCIVLGWLGYVFGSQWELVRQYMRPFDIPIIIAGIVLAGWYIYNHVKRNRAYQAQAVSEEADK